MTEEKMILNDGQYDEQYDLEIKTHQISVSADVLADKGWYKLAGDEQIVKKAVLSKEEAEWFEKYKDLPFYERTSSNHFICKLFGKLSCLRDSEKQADFFRRQAQAYFNGYTIEKEKKYYIKLEFNRSDVSYLNINEFGVLFLSSKHELADAKTQFTQAEIDKMQKDPQAKGLDLNVLKIEVPEDELED